MIAEIKDNVPLRAEGLDEAIIGSDYTDQRTVYSIELILEVLMVRDEMSVEEAVEVRSW